MVRTCDKGGQNLWDEREVRYHQLSSFWRHAPGNDPLLLLVGLSFVIARHEVQMAGEPVDVPRVNVGVFPGHDGELGASSRLSRTQMIKKKKLLKAVLAIPHPAPNLALMPHHAARVVRHDKTLGESRRHFFHQR